MTEHAESSHRYMAVENMHASSPLSFGSAAFTNFQACLHVPTVLTALTHQQTGIEETVTYQTTTSDYYRPLLEQLDMNPNATTMMASSYPMQMPQSPIHNLPSQHILGFDLLRETPPSVFTVDYMF